MLLLLQHVSSSRCRAMRFGRRQEEVETLGSSLRLLKIKYWGQMSGLVDNLSLPRLASRRVAGIAESSRAAPRCTWSRRLNATRSARSKSCSDSSRWSTAGEAATVCITFCGLRSTQKGTCTVAALLSDVSNPRRNLGGAPSTRPWLRGGLRLRGLISNLTVAGADLAVERRRRTSGRRHDRRQPSLSR